MKELEKHVPLKEQIVKEQHAPNTLIRKVGRMRVKKGHKMWKLDSHTGEITEFNKFAIKLKSNGKIQKSLTRIGNRYHYLLALNKKNAKRRFVKKGEEAGMIKIEVNQVKDKWVATVTVGKIKPWKTKPAPTKKAARKKAIMQLSIIYL